MSLMVFVRMPILYIYCSIHLYYNYNSCEPDNVMFFPDCACPCEGGRRTPLSCERGGACSIRKIHLVLETIPHSFCIERFSVQWLVQERLVGDGIESRRPMNPLMCGVLFVSKVPNGASYL